MQTNQIIHLAVIIVWFYIVFKFGKVSSKFAWEILTCRCHPVHSMIARLICSLVCMTLLFWVGWELMGALNHFFPL